MAVNRRSVFRSDDLSIEPFSVLNNRLNSFMQDNDLTHADIEDGRVEWRGCRVRTAGRFV